MGLREGEGEASHRGGVGVNLCPDACNTAGKRHPIRIMPRLIHVVLYSMTEFLEGFLCPTRCNKSLYRGGKRIYTIGADGH